jgi:3-oxoacyl-[acyl-carrier-protein] synthase II
MTKEDAGVVISGVGLVTPLGNDYPTFAANLLSGTSPARVLVDRDGGVEVALPVCQAEDPPAPAGWDAAAFAGLPRSQRLVLACCQAALEDAGLSVPPPNLAAGPDVPAAPLNGVRPRDGLRFGLVLGSGGEMLRRWEGDWMRGGREVFEGRGDERTLAELAGWRLGLAGPRLTVAAACASANYAIEIGRRWIEQGLVDGCLVGGVETLTPICRAAFYNLRALSRRTDDPQRASRPFDRDRDGFVMGEGAAILLLEPAAQARAQKRRVYAEVAGFGASSDACHMIIPSSDPAPAAAAIRSALSDARLDVAQVDYINAHATSTPVGDRAEARALAEVFGPSLAQIPVSSTKSMTGHLLSAAAAVEALACLVALERQQVPPTINLEHPDPQCALRHVPQRAMPHRVTVALSNSFGFGGSNTTLVLRKAA